MSEIDGIRTQHTGAAHAVQPCCVQFPNDGEWSACDVQTLIAEIDSLRAQLDARTERLADVEGSPHP